MLLGLAWHWHGLQHVPLLFLRLFTHSDCETCTWPFMSTSLEASTAGCAARQSSGSRVCRTAYSDLIAVAETQCA